ncbi:putative transporter small subunit [Orrella sp. JC864]
MWLTAYFLIWPVLGAAIMAVLLAALRRDLRAAKRDGTSMV